MLVHLEYAAQVKREAGTARESLESSQPLTLADLLSWACARRGDDFSRLLLKPDGRVQPTLLIFINDRQTPPDGGAPLQDGDVVTVMSPISGG